MHHSPGLDPFHHLAPAHHRGEREAGRERLGEHRQVRSHPEEALRPLEADAKSGDHLVEDEHDTMLRGDRAH